MTVYDFGIQNFEPTRVTPQSKTGLAHKVSRELIETTTLRTTISDQYTVLGYTALKTEKNEVMEVIKQLKVKKTVSCDGITIEIIKCCSSVGNSLANVFKKCIVESTLP